MAQSITSQFNGVVFEDLLMSMVERMDAINKGLLGLHTGFNQDLHLPVIDVNGVVTGNVDDITAAYKAQPTLTTDSTGTADYDEPTKITLVDRMVFIDNIIPNAWRSVWNEYAPNFNQFLLDLQVNPKIQQGFSERILQRVSAVNAYNVWQGDTVTTGATYANFDGIFKKLADIGTGAGGYNETQGTATAALAAANIVDAFLATEQAVLDGNTGLYQSPDFKFVVSHKTASIYRDSQITQYTGKGPTDINVGGDFRTQTGASMDFRGIPIYASVGFPDNVIMATRTSLDPISSTLHLGLRNQGDMDYIKFDQVNAYSEAYFFKMAYSIGTAVTTPQDIYLYDVRP